MLEDLNKTIPKNLEKALFLSPEQVQAITLTLKMIHFKFYPCQKSVMNIMLSQCNLDSRPGFHHGFGSIDKKWTS
jgi:hypothetical protein